MAKRVFDVFGEIILRKRGVDEGLKETEVAAKETAGAIEQTADAADKASVALERESQAAGKAATETAKATAAAKTATPAIEAVAEAEQAVADAAPAASRAVRETGDEIKKVAPKADDLTRSMSRLQALLARIFIPALIAKQVTSIISEIDRLRAKTAELEADSKRASVAFSRGFLADARALSGMSELDQKIRAVQDSVAAQKQEMSDRAEAEAALLREADLWTKLKNSIAGVTEESVRAAAMAGFDTIGQQADLHIERLRAADAEKRRNEQLDQSRRDAQARRNQEQSDYDRALQLERENHLLGISTIEDDQQRAKAEAGQAIADLEMQRDKETDQRIVAAYNKRIALERELLRIRLEGIQKAEDEQDSRQRQRHEEAMRQIDRESEARRRAADQIALRLGVNPQNASSLIDQIQPVKRIRTSTGGG